MAQCRGFRPGCTNEATHTDMGYAFCLECARQFAGYTPEPIEASLLERLLERMAALLAAARVVAERGAIDHDSFICPADAWLALRDAIEALEERE